jgi:general secretion pathway protein D
VNLKMSNDAKIIFDTIGKLAGLTIIYDPDFPARRVSVDLNNVTLEQALDVMSVESKAHWTPMTENIILVFPDQPQKRRDYEEQVMRTFYLSNTVQPQELTEIVTGLRQLLDLKRIQQLNARNAIVIRATPGQLALAEKFIQDIDTAQPEVVVPRYLKRAWIRCAIWEFCPGKPPRFQSFHQELLRSTTTMLRITGLIQERPRLQPPAFCRFRISRI